MYTHQYLILTTQYRQQVSMRHLVHVLHEVHGSRDRVHGFAEPVPIAINPVQHAEDKLCKPDAELWHTKPVLGSSVLAPIDASV
jgi:hypothetical protein